jgi:Protein of unknown function (DUF1353)
MLRIIVLMCAVFCLCDSAIGQFVGTLEFTPEGCESTGICNIKSDFKYKDPNNVEWLTQAGAKKDGASIPTWAQPFIGQPFDKDFIKVP